MKSKENYFSARGHTAIRTRYVYSENEQVYLKNDMESKRTTVEQEEWCPINFQWIPVFRLQAKLLSSVK